MVQVVEELSRQTADLIDDRATRTQKTQPEDVEGIRAKAEQIRNMGLHLRSVADPILIEQSRTDC